MIDGIRFSGLASGMDTEGIVKKLMSAERMKVDRYHQQKTKNTWRQEQLHEMNKSFASFIVESRKKLGLTTRASNGVMVSSGYERVDWVNQATVSDDKVLGVKATVSALKGKHTVEVEQLAEGVRLSSKGKLDARVSIASVIQEDYFSDGKMDVMINDKRISISSTDNMAQVADKIKDATGLNARFDTGSGKFFISTSNTGAQATMKFGSKGDSSLNTNTKKLLDAMNLSVAGFDGTAVKELQGRNAKIKFDGSESIEYPTNQVSIMGLDLTLKNVSASPVEVEVRTDTDAIIGKVKEFVEEYNKVIDMTNKKLSEKPNRSYQPLTDEQREAMKEKDIELWEEKAKEGLLNNDSILAKAMQSIRDGLYEKVYDVVKNEDGSYKKTAIGSMYELGIDNVNWREGGKLSIDEDKLRKAIADDPDRVMKILFRSSDIAEAKIDEKDDDAARQRKLQQNRDRQDGMGIVSRIYDRMTNAISDIVTESGPGKETALLRNVKQTLLLDYVTKGSKSKIDRDIFALNDIIDNQNKKLAGIEERYWKKFTALEKAIQQMQSQSGWLAQQMGGMMG